MPVATLFHVITTNTDAKLGRCARCMRLSAVLTAGSLLTLSAATLANFSLLQFVAAVVALPSIGLSLAHAVAYFIREPATSTCTPCAKKAQRARRTARMRRIRSLFSLRRTTARGIRTDQKCLACKAASLETLRNAPEQLPQADANMLGAMVRESSEYLAIADQLESLEPDDTWQGDMRNFYLFRLRPNAEGLSRQALFVARWEDYQLLSAVVITPNRDGGEPQVLDLRALRA